MSQPATSPIHRVKKQWLPFQALFISSVFYCYIRKWAYVCMYENVWLPLCVYVCVYVTAYANSR